jgi:hypothetical protein
MMRLRREWSLANLVRDDLMGGHHAEALDEKAQ